MWRMLSAIKAVFIGVNEQQQTDLWLLYGSFLMLLCRWLCRLLCRLLLRLRSRLLCRLLYRLVMERAISGDDGWLDNLIIAEPVLWNRQGLYSR